MDQSLKDQPMKRDHFLWQDIWSWLKTTVSLQDRLLSSHLQCVVLSAQVGIASHSVCLLQICMCGAIEPYLINISPVMLPGSLSMIGPSSITGEGSLVMLHNSSI